MKKLVLFISCTILLIVVFVLTESSQNKSIKISDADSQVIAVLDTGLNSLLLKEHKNNIVKTYNVVDNSESVEDFVGHGTSMISLLLGSKEYNIEGILPKTKVIIIKITDNEGKSSLKNLFKGLEIAELYEADVINISLGGDVESENINTKLDELIKKDITVVCSSGDYGEKDLLYPANKKNVISVASVNNNFEISEFSNYNKNVTCAFPGENLSILSIKENQLDKTNELYGTSFSAIYASAYIANVRDYFYKKNIQIANDKIFNIMREINPYKIKEIVINKEF